jgi:hypothetical protein
MSSDVRVRVRLGALRLEYEGERAFYEAHVERMVEAAARRDLSSGAVVASPTSNGVATPRAAAPAEPRAQAEPSAPSSAPPAPSLNGTAARFAPQSSEFGKFIRKLGPEAGEPDRQVVALAFYLWNYEKRATFGREELEGCWRALGMPSPAGVEDILHDLTERKRFLEPADEHTWRLSRKGENYVKTRLLAGA